MLWVPLFLAQYVPLRLSHFPPTCVDIACIKILSSENVLKGFLQLRISSGSTSSSRGERVPVAMLLSAATIASSMGVPFKQERRMPDCPEDTDDHARGTGAIALLQVREREPPPGHFHRDGLPDPMIRSVHPKSKSLSSKFFYL